MILHRLVYKGKVAGYEWHLKEIGDNISIIHCDEYYDDLGSIFNNDRYPIQHDRKDRYTGIDIDEERLFERDEFEWVDIERASQSTVINKGFVEMRNGSWVVEHSYDPNTYTLLAYISSCINSKIIGIQGITE